MKNNIYQFKLKHRPARTQVMQWLMSIINDEWPKSMDFDIGKELFHGWRFIRCTDGEIVFANCIDRGITEKDFYEFLGVVHALKFLASV